MPFGIAFGYFQLYYLAAFFFLVQQIYLFNVDLAAINNNFPLKFPIVLKHSRVNLKSLRWLTANSLVLEIAVRK